MRDLGEILTDIGLEMLTETIHGYKALCPYPEHSDSAPSFYIHKGKGITKCFGCQRFMPLFDFLVYHGVPFDEAIEFYVSSDNKEAKQKKEDVGGFILGNLIPKSFIDRGFTIPTLEYFRVGYDVFAEHTTIPMIDQFGKIVGVKYRQYPKSFWYSEGFNKDGFIYNYAPTNERWYVEGETDTWRMHQMGIKNVSAFLTNAPTDTQAGMMTEHSKVILMLDNDIAGYRGIFKAQSKLQRYTELYVAIYPTDDPGDLKDKKSIEVIPFSLFEVKFINANKNLYEEVKNESK